MNKIRIATIEDEPTERETLGRYIAQYGTNNGISIEVSEFVDAETFLREPTRSFDIVFMDIELPGMDGMTAMAEFRKKDSDTVVIFVTNLAGQAVNGYSVKAFDFIVKPVNYNNFALKLGAAIECLKTKRSMSVWIVSKFDMTKIDSDDIYYIEVRGHALTYHTASGDMTATGTLNAVEQELKNAYFVRCNNCYLVNLKYVRKISGFFVYVNDEQLSMSRAKKQAFMRALNDYLAKGGFDK